MYYAPIKGSQQVALLINYMGGSRNFSKEGSDIEKQNKKKNAKGSIRCMFRGHDFFHSQMEVRHVGGGGMIFTQGNLK